MFQNDLKVIQKSFNKIVLNDSQIILTNHSKIIQKNIQEIILNVTQKSEKKIIPKLFKNCPKMIQQSLKD